MVTPPNGCLLLRGLFTDYVYTNLPKIDHLPTLWLHLWRNFFTEISKGKSASRWHFQYHLPTSSCQRSLWTPSYCKGTNTYSSQISVNPKHKNIKICIFTNDQLQWSFFLYNNQSIGFWSRFCYRYVVHQFKNWAFFIITKNLYLSYCGPKDHCVIFFWGTIYIYIRVLFFTRENKWFNFHVFV